MRVAFLISRQKRLIGPSTWWLRAAHASTRWAVDQGWALLGSGGLVPLDFIAWSFRHHGGAVETVLMSPRSRKKSDRHAAMKMRDGSIADAADTFVAVSVRAGGIMEQEGLNAIRAGKCVRVVRPPARTADFAGSWNLLRAGGEELLLPSLDKPAGGAGRFAKDAEQPSDDSNVICLRPNDGGWSECPIPKEYLWHFTRARIGPWPGQSADDYFMELASADTAGAHTGLDALKRIIADGALRASAKTIRGKIPVVSFTEELPSTVLSGRTFRRSLARWDFEPYAIGIPREAAIGSGARAVQYLTSTAFQNLSPADRPFFQKHEAEATDWRHEKEWRIAGDVPLRAFGQRVRVIIPAIDKKRWTAPD